MMALPGKKGRPVTLQYGIFLLMLETNIIAKDPGSCYA
jgi:hypothetical protein